MRSPDSLHAAYAGEAPAASGQARRKLQRRTLTIVVFSQVSGGAGLAAGITVGALLAHGECSATKVSQEYRRRCSLLDWPGGTTRGTHVPPPGPTS